jgi:DNA-binding NarL/FixJ family response regulator
MSSVIRCMIAEDDKQLNDIYYNLLNYEKDIEVVGRAFNGSELIKLISEKEVNIILLDIEMENSIDGIEVCKEILKGRPNIKIIILSCHDEEDIILSAFEAGAVDYVLKTSSSSHILESIYSANNNSSSINSYVAGIIRNRLKEFGILKENLFEVMNVLSVLTGSELGVLKLLLKGKKQKEIAKIRNVELVTIKSHVSSILRKFDLNRMHDVVNIIENARLQAFVEKMKSD